MPPALRRRLCATSASLLLPLTLLATTQPVEAGATATTRTSSGKTDTRTADSTTVSDSSGTRSAATSSNDDASKTEDKFDKSGVKSGQVKDKSGKSGGKQALGRSYSMTWQSNESQSKDRAIYHCARQNRIVGRAHIVDRADAARFSCQYNKRTDWPYGVKVFQPAGRRLVVKVGTKVVRDYDPQSYGQDVWVVAGNPTGWWRTFIT